MFCIQTQNKTKHKKIHDPYADTRHIARVCVYVRVYVRVYVYVCVCVCVRERERESGGKRNDDSWFFGLVDQ